MVRNMVSIFVAPGSVKNIEKSVARGVAIEELRVKDESLRARLYESYPERRAYLWGLNRRREALWQKVKPGDYIFFYVAGLTEIRYISKVIFTYPFEKKREQLAEAEEIASRIWGRNLRGETWSLLIFLTQPKEIVLRLEEFRVIAGYRFPGGVGIFFQVDPERAKKLQEYIKKYAI